MKRVIIIVLDGVGAGELPDAQSYGDSGSNTLSNTAAAVDGIYLPNMAGLGLGLINSINGILPKADVPSGFYGRIMPESPGKDTISGHWEMMGVIVEKPFRTYPNGFPSEVIDEFEKRIGRKILGNVVASGTEIIERLGKEHLATGNPIVYTSADSVFQVAAHEEVISVSELFKMCEIARSLLVGDNLVGRVIARPFIGFPGSFKRTDNRKDFAVEPQGTTLLEILAQNDKYVIGIGKIGDIFSGIGIAESIHTRDNCDGMSKILRTMEVPHVSLIFANLVDFDMLYGHRNDPIGFSKALIEFDRWLPSLISRSRPDDLIIITSDHGCDPTTPSTDHSREYGLLLVFNKQAKVGQALGVRKFSDVGKTASHALGVKWEGPGTSFLSDILGRV